MSDSRGRGTGQEPAPVRSMGSRFRLAREDPASKRAGQLQLARHSALARVGQGHRLGVFTLQVMRYEPEDVGLCQGFPRPASGTMTHSLDGLTELTYYVMYKSMCEGNTWSL